MPGIYQAANTAEIHHRDGYGGPDIWGVFLYQDRVLPSPSPSANLEGFWKDVIWMMVVVVFSAAGT
jgi:hypothetical protein